MVSQTDKSQKIILFDGVCNLCVASVQFIIRHDANSEFVFSPLQSNYSQMLDIKYNFQQQRIDINDPDSFILIVDDQIFTRSDAWIKICASLTGWPRMLSVFRFMPVFIRDWGYDLIGKHRYRWFGKRDACLIPTPEIQNRFR